MASPRDTSSASSVGPTAAFALAALAVGVAAWIRLDLDPLLGNRFTYAPFFLAVLWASAYGGAGSGLLAAFLGAAMAVRFLVPPRRSFVVEGADNLANLLVYLVVSFGIVFLASAMRRALLEAERLAARALRDGEQLRVTLASIGDAVIVTDAAGLVTSMNAVAESMTGVKEAQGRGRALEETLNLVDEDTRQRLPSPVAKALRDGKVATLGSRTMLIARGGQERSVDDSASPIRGEDGEILGAVLVFREIGERRRSEEIQRRLASIVENSEDAIIGKSLEGTITSWNAGAERLYGYSAREVIGKPSAFLTPGDRLGEQSAVLVKLKDRKVTETFETVRRAKDGRLIDVSMSMAPIRDAAGNVIGSSTIARDITQQRRTAEEIRRLNRDLENRLAELGVAQERLRQSELDLADFFENASVGLHWVGADGTILRVNRAELEMLGYTRDEYVGHDITEFHADRAVIDDILRRLHRGDTIHDQTAQMRCKDGSVRDVLIDSSALWVHGEFVHTRCFTVDVTDRKRAEEALQKSEHGLREADRNKNDFLAVLSHELRNPLAPLLNALAILKRPDATGATLTEARDMAERQVHHLSRLVDDLLDVARITHGKIELRREYLELSTVVARAVETALPAIEGRRHELTVSLPPEAVWLHADGVRIAQVFSNLLNNSAKYTTPGGQITLTVSEVGTTVVVRVRDTGIGIPKEALSRVFEMFAQAGPEDSRSPMSLGVGLRLVKSLVELHGGTVEASSAGPGKGSEFVVRLPTVARPQRGVEEPAQARQPISSRRVLVVDDNADAAASLAVLLKLEGHDARVAHSGPSALAAVEESTPEVVFLDIGMPGMDGFEVARRLRAQHGVDGLRLVALTGWGQEHDRQRAREAGFDHHLTKPVAPTDLHAVLSKASSI